MATTSEQILDAAELLIQRGGYHAFSFQDIAERIGIKKASIYYHHPAKAELGRAVIARYRRRFKAVMATVEARKDISNRDALELYLEPILALQRGTDRICLCAVLGGEYMALPEAMRAEVAGFFDEHHKWLAALLGRGRRAGEFVFEGQPGKLAKLMLSAVEGAMMVKRATNNPKHVDDVVGRLGDLLKAP